MPIGLTELHSKFVANCIKYPVILEMLSTELGVSIESLQALEVGFYPVHQSWIFPERDETGKIVGLMERFRDGTKIMLKGDNFAKSQRGLIYVFNTGYNYYDKKKWVRVSRNNPCRLCGKSDGCLFPEGEDSNPAAIVCVHESKGSVRQLTLGYLHILDAGRNAHRTGKSVLIQSDFPYLVVEGSSDVCAAYDLGFMAIGRPSAAGGMSLIRKLLEGKKACVIGENDKGAGVEGMESAFKNLNDSCASVTKILPPDGIKDLRVWKNQGLTQDDLIIFINTYGNSDLDPNIFEDAVASTIAKCWIQREKTKNGCVMVRNYKGSWAEWNGNCYDSLDKEMFRGQIYSFLEGKKYYHKNTNGDVSILQYEPTKAKVNDIVDALSQWCPIIDDPPKWIVKTEMPEPVDLIVFKNGILDVNEYVQGRIKLYNPTPELFTFDALPYDFDEDLESDLWNNFLMEIFNGDDERIRLLAQWFGYNCVPDMSFEKLMLFRGRPRSGKSTVLETMQHMLGDRQCCETSFQSLTGSFGYQPLLGKLSAIIGDAKSPKSGDANAVLEKILHITGGDAVSVNRKGLPELPHVHLKCRFTIGMNDLPTFTDHSRALEARLNVINFPNSYVGREDISLKIRLKKEAAMGKVINFALRGLWDVRTSKGFLMPESSLPELNQFREICSPIMSFANECLEFSDYGLTELFTTKDQLFDIYKAWCGQQGRQHGFKESFCRNFLAAYPDVSTTRKRIGNLRQYVFEGVSITPEAFKEYFGQ